VSENGTWIDKAGNTWTPADGRVLPMSYYIFEDDWDNELAKAKAAERERCIKAVEDEPEPNHPTPMVAAIVRAVKSNIIDRIKKEVQGE